MDGIVDCHRVKFKGVWMVGVWMLLLTVIESSIKVMWLVLLTVIESSIKGVWLVLLPVIESSINSELRTQNSESFI